MDYVLLTVTFGGALISELLSIYADMIGCKTFLKKLWPGKSDRFYFIIDALLMPFIGTALAYFIMEPESLKTAFCAGLTWCGTLQTLGLTLKSETTTTIKESGGKTTVSSTTKTTKKVMPLIALLLVSGFFVSSGISRSNIRKELIEMKSTTEKNDDGTRLMELEKRNERLNLIIGRDKETEKLIEEVKHIDVVK